jgi:hypothetical protein
MRLIRLNDAMQCPGFWWCASVCGKNSSLDGGGLKSLGVWVELCWSFSLSSTGELQSWCLTEITRKNRNLFVYKLKLITIGNNCPIATLTSSRDHDNFILFTIKLNFILLLLQQQIQSRFFTCYVSIEQSIAHMLEQYGFMARKLHLRVWFHR